MSIVIEQWHRHHDREEKGVDPSACFLEFVCLSVFCWLRCRFTRLRVCVFVRSFVCGVAWGGCVKVCFG